MPAGSFADDYMDRQIQRTIERSSYTISKATEWKHDESRKAKQIKYAKRVQQVLVLFSASERTVCKDTFEWLCGGKSSSLSFGQFRQALFLGGMKTVARDVPFAEHLFQVICNLDPTHQSSDDGRRPKYNENDASGLFDSSGEKKKQKRSMSSMAYFTLLSIVLKQGMDKQLDLCYRLFDLTSDEKLSVADIFGSLHLLNSELDFDVSRLYRALMDKQNRKLKKNKGDTEKQSSKKMEAALTFVEFGHAFCDEPQSSNKEDDVQKPGQPGGHHLSTVVQHLGVTASRRESRIITGQATSFLQKGNVWQTKPKEQSVAKKGSGSNHQGDTSSPKAQSPRQSSQKLSAVQRIIRQQSSKRGRHADLQNISSTISFTDGRNTEDQRYIICDISLT